MSAPSLRLSSEVGFKQWIEKAIDSPDPWVREEETSSCVQNVNAVIALIKFDTAALRSGGSFILRREGGSAPNRIERSRESRVGFGIGHWCTSETPVKSFHRCTDEI